MDATTAQIADGSVKNAIISAVRKNPAIKYIATTLAGAMTGLRQGLDSAGLNDVKIGVAGATPDQFEAVRKGDIDIIGKYGTPESYYATLDQILRYSEGMNVLQDEHAIRPYQLFDKDTVGNTNSWEGPEGYQDQWLKLWGVS